MVYRIILIILILKIFKIKINNIIIILYGFLYIILYDIFIYHLMWLFSITFHMIYYNKNNIFENFQN
jgi:hypothetical protein